MIEVLLTEPFSLPTPVHASYFDRARELAPVLAEYGIAITDDPARADFEIRGGLGTGTQVPAILPMNRLIVVDGEPPQPEFLLPYYRMHGLAGVLCPANLKVCAPDGLAYLQRPPQPWRDPVFRPGILQLTTWRSHPIPRMAGLVNGRDLFDWRVLCTWRCQVGLQIKEMRPEFIDICGRGWPPGIVIEDSRGGDWYQRKLDLCAGYAFNLCWENMEIPYYVTEKLWDPIIAGSLPLYWGPPEMHERIPKDTVIDCRRYEKEPGVFDTASLLSDLDGMSEEEWQRRITVLREWMWSYPEDARKRSLAAVAHRLGETIERAAQTHGVQAGA